jgi:hypothetical protein
LEFIAEVLADAASTIKQLNTAALFVCGRHAAGQLVDHVHGSGYLE